MRSFVFGRVPLQGRVIHHVHPEMLTLLGRAVILTFLGKEQVSWIALKESWEDDSPVSGRRCFQESSSLQACLEGWTVVYVFSA